MAKLTPRQERFVQEYLIDLNATAAAIRAGYSVKNADKIGSQLLGKIRVADAINRELAKRSKRTGISQDRVLRELAKIAFANATDVINIQEATVNHDATRDDTAVIQAIKVKKIAAEAGDIIEREIKLYDKQKALELLGKHLGMFTDKLNVSGELGVKIIDDINDRDKA